MLIVTDFWRSFPANWTASTGVKGKSVSEVWTLTKCLEYCDNPDTVFVINAAAHAALLLQLAAVFTLRPKLRKPLISVDVVLRAPVRAIHYAVLPLKRFLLSRVDHHILYFTDLRGYKKWFGVGPERSSYVPFKVNVPFSGSIEGTSGGEYVLCFGRSQRDWHTFFEAMRLVPYPGAVSRSSLPAAFLKDQERLPKNVTVLDDDGTAEAQIPLLSRARVVALPILKSNIAASGLSTCFNAMALGKCVIGTEGPGFSDIFSNGEVITVPPGDPVALAHAIRRVWEDEQLRKETALRGYRYVCKAGSRDDLYQRIIDQVVQWHAQATSSGP
jgi:glycosyltransferase involved in cell wall biosynthesis